MVRTTLLVAAWLFMLAAAWLPAGEPDRSEESSTQTVEVEKESLRISISLPKRGDQRTLSVGDSAAEFHVVLTNVSAAPIRLWKEWCSWGYFNLSFELQLGDDKPVPIVKLERGWDKNYPDAVEIPPGEHLVLPVRLRGDEWKLEFGKKEAGPWPARLRAFYDVSPDDESRRLGVWTGRVESAAIDVMLHD